MLPARLEQLHALRSFVEAFCAQAALGGDACLRLNLLLEELFTNTVRHGHRGECDAPVWLSLGGEDDGRVTVSYEDTARPFNPFAGVSPDTTQEIRKLDGRGLLLLHTLSLTRDYAYLYGRNRIRLALNPG
ncbi:MAG TPA: ATP-binding protein [Burkholderiales bacterium]|nr:ATP-binding protein [Burkholderiales bacterium]